jgi:hypothetical protein
MRPAALSALLDGRSCPHQADSARRNLLQAARVRAQGGGPVRVAGHLPAGPAAASGARMARAPDVSAWAGRAGRSAVVLECAARWHFAWWGRLGIFGLVLVLLLGRKWCLGKSVRMGRDGTTVIICAGAAISENLP